jgi:Fe2+ transport system protein FeoA
MLHRWLGRWSRNRAKAPANARCAACPLAACERGSRAAVLRMDCDSSEAGRLRNLGLFEGACVTVIDQQDGLLLEVRGARLALGAALASAITVLPLGS